MTKKLFLLSVLVLLLSKGSFSQPSERELPPLRTEAFDFTPYKHKKVALSEQELELYSLLMEYRVQNGLPQIPLSVALTYVAQAHAGDLSGNYQAGGRCTLNSWSKKGEWIPCCYLKDHSKAECMWDKPKELTSYPGDGFEIVFRSPVSPTPAAALELWKSNPLNDSVLRNTGNWSKTTWKAIGIGIWGAYVSLWLGKEPDNDGFPEMPEAKN